MSILIRMSRTQKVAPDGFTVVTALKDEVYSVPDDLGRLLVEEKAAALLEGPAPKRPLAPDRVLPGRALRPAADRY